MKVRILSTSNHSGGAARAASRLNNSIFYYGKYFRSEMQVADYKLDINNVIKPSSHLETGWYLGRKYFGKIIQKSQKSQNKVLHSSAILPSLIHRKLNKCDADIINLHWIQGEFMSIKSISLINKPIVWTFHDLWPFLGTEHYPRDYNDRRFIDGYDKKNRFNDEKGIDLDLISWKLKKLYFKKPIQIVCNSSWLSSFVKKSSLMSSWPVSVIPNPIPTDIYKPWPKDIARNLFNLPLDTDLIIFGALGGTENFRKGWQLLEKALNRLSRRKKNLHAVIFGQHEPKVKPNINMPLTYIGCLNDDQSLAMLYSASDVVVVPSLMETLPQLATEAQSCGVPVVAFNCSGLIDAVDNMKTGYLAKPFDTDDLSNGIEWVLKKENFKTLSIESRKRAQRLWSYKIITAKYEEIYQKVLTNKF